MQETKVAELEAQREEQRLQATVRRPADAQAYHQTTLARAERDARISAAEAQRQGGRAAGRGQRPAGEDRGRGRSRAGAPGRRRPRPSTSGWTPRRAPSRPGPSARPRRPPPPAKGHAEGDAIRARGLAEAEAIKARADALAENQDAVIGQQLAQQWPAIVEAAAKPFGDIDQLIVLNGATGLTEMLGQALSQGAAGMQLARNLLSRQGGDEGGNGDGKAAAPSTPSNGRPSVPDKTPTS